MGPVLIPTTTRSSANSAAACPRHRSPSISGDQVHLPQESSMTLWTRLQTLATRFFPNCNRPIDSCNCSSNIRSPLLWTLTPTPTTPALASLSSRKHATCRKSYLQEQMMTRVQAVESATQNHSRKLVMCCSSIHGYLPRKPSCPSNNMPFLAVQHKPQSWYTYLLQTLVQNPN